MGVDAMDIGVEVFEDIEDIGDDDRLIEPDFSSSSPSDLIFEMGWFLLTFLFSMFLSMASLKLAYFWWELVFIMASSERGGCEGEIPNGWMGEELKLSGYCRWFCVWGNMGRDGRCGRPCMEAMPARFRSGLNCSGVGGGTCGVWRLARGLIRFICGFGGKCCFGDWREDTVVRRSGF